MATESDNDRPVQTAAADDPRALAATKAVQAGDLATLESLLAADPWLATARIGDADCYRTLLHAATDWPGQFPNGPAVVKRLVAAGADVNSHSQFSSHTETPLHWAASSDDVARLMHCSTPVPTSRRLVPCSAAAARSPMHADLVTGRRPEGSSSGVHVPG